MTREPHTGASRAHAPAEAESSRTSLLGMSRADLRSLLASAGEPAYRADQLFAWIHAKRAHDFPSMSNLPAPLRDRLSAAHAIDRPRVEKMDVSTDGTRKYLMAVKGGRIESVFMPEPSRVTFCLSSQVGCALDCHFCLTATMGFGRNLSSEEIVGQALLLLDDPELGGRPVNLVFMGMGEPLHNYDALMAAFRILTDPAGAAIPRRRVTVSTAGLVPGIRRLAAETERPHLAVSLNAATDEVRSRIMPINRKYPIDVLLDAAAAFPLAPRERLTFEYVMLAGVNDSMQEAKLLPRLVRRHKLRAKVNLIPFNPGADLGFDTPPMPVIKAFRDVLISGGLPCSIRKNRGRDISAACGQLAAAGAEGGGRPRGGRKLPGTGA